MCVQANKQNSASISTMTCILMNHDGAHNHVHVYFNRIKLTIPLLSLSFLGGLSLVLDFFSSNIVSDGSLPLLTVKPEPEKF